MSGVNKVILVGNLGGDPEIRNNNDGDRMAFFSVATGESWRDKNTRERRERTEWHRVVVFNERLAEVAEKYLKKGSKVYIEGKLRTRKWTDQSGQDKYNTEVVLDRFRGEITMLGSSGQGGPPRAEPGDYDGEPRDEGPQTTGADDGDEIPF